MKERKYPKFTKEQRSTFRYWFWHWLAFNDVAREMGVWKIHHLFHDIEKPWLRLFLPYRKVQEIHRHNNPHHLEYKDPANRDWIDMVIDWECSGRTKEACPRNAIEEATHKLDEKTMSYMDYCKFYATYRYLLRHKEEIFTKNHVKVVEKSC